MKQYQTFIFDSHSFNPKTGRITLKYSLDDTVNFTEILKLPKSDQWSVVSGQSDAALFALHLIAGISYYKTCCPRKIEIRSGALTPEQADFWNAVYENGLGEFFYRNNIDFQGLIRFPASLPAETPRWGVSTNEQRITNNEKQRVLVPLGGGKDSIVTLELLRSAGIAPTLLRMNPHPIVRAIARKARLPLLSVERHLSPALLKLNTQGALNGHVPITAYLSFLSTLIAILGDFNALVMSNERSASAGNVLFHGKEVNHQWSKSLAFERMFQQYIRAYVAPELDAFSLLRPLSELHIAKLFAQYPKYFPCATSCNANWKLQTTNYKLQTEGRWCGACPKCAFAFCLLAAWLPKDTILSIFGKNLFDDPSLFPVFRALLGLEGMKPFECVGTPEETKAAFLLIRERGEFTDTSVMQMFLRECLATITDAQKLMNDALTPSTDHAIPPDYAGILSRSTLHPQAEVVSLKS